MYPSPLPQALPSKFCVHCGQHILAEAAFCAKCGGAQPTLYYPQPQKNRVLAALLAFTLGAFGVHKFYLDRKGQGVLYLLFFWTLIPGVLAFFETFRYLLMSDQEFAARYPG